MLCMHDDTGKIITVIVQSKQNTQSYIIDTAFHSPVHGLCMIGIIMLWSRRMKFFIGIFTVSLLKQNISSYSCLFQFRIIFYRGSCYIHIHTADGAIFMFNIVNRVDTFQNILQRIIYRIFPCFNCQAFVAHILQCHHFLPYFFLGKFFSADVFVFQMIRTVFAAIDTVV